MFRYRPRPVNYVAEEHRDPLVAIFLVGGVAGVGAALHYALIIAGGYTNDQVFQWLVSGLSFTGMLSVGLYRSFQLIRSKNMQNKRFVAKLLCIVCAGAFSSFLGALPLGYIDYSGAELIGFGLSVPEFWRTVGVVVGIGAIMSVCIGFVFIKALMQWEELTKRIKFGAIVLGAVCAGVCVIVCVPIVGRSLLFSYVVVFGIVFGYTFIVSDR